MSEHRPEPLGEDISDLADLCEQVRQRVAFGVHRADPFDLFTDPPFASHRAMVFVLRCDLAVMLIGAAAVVAAFFSVVSAIAIAALGALVFVVRWLVHWRFVAPVPRRLAECEVVPAVVVQAWRGGFVPREEVVGGTLFSGVVVFSFDESVTIAHLGGLARRLLQAKSGTEAGPMAELRRMLVTGDTAFVHGTFHVPAAIAGDDRTFATPILFERDNDLALGYLSTAAQLILAHPRAPQHVCPVPLPFWDSSRSRELLNGQ